MSTPTTAIVIAAGNATRWNNYGGIPKHLVQIGGEPILHRTVRLLKQHVPTVWVVAKNDARYHQHGANIYTVEPRDSDADKFYSSQRIWSGHTLIVYGDCYFTDEAVTAMTAPVDDWTLFCRPHPSTITGSEHGECWAYSIPEKNLDFVKEKLIWLAGMHELGETWRCGGWELYRALLGQDLHNDAMTSNYVVIDDWTEDFDFPRDYEVWLHRRHTRSYIPIDPFNEPD